MDRWNMDMMLCPVCKKPIPPGQIRCGNKALHEPPKPKPMKR